MLEISIETLVYFVAVNAQTFGEDRSKPGNIWTHCTVAFMYTDKDGEVTSRVAEPRRVFKNKKNDKMLLAWCPTSREWKTFSYDSISDICTGGIALELLRHKNLKETKHETKHE